MTHVLIGSAEGWKYKPFGIDRIRAMRAAGLQYASQTFTVEGFTIKVRIVGTQDYIEINGVSCSYSLDSGVVSATYFGTKTIAPVSYLPGVMYDTSTTKNYNASFGVKSGIYLTNPSKTSDGQFTGVLSYSGVFQGALRADKKPVSFSPAQVVQLVGNVPTTVDSTTDAHLTTKKNHVLNCPASSFTGRCRLYVQSLYGAPLYDASGNVNFPCVLVDATSFVIKCRKNPVTGSTTDVLIIDTNCGVWLDKTTGKHWLFKPGLTSVLIYPLIADSCGEAARSVLKAATLSTTDAKHLEAYILSTCVPDISKLQSAPFIETGPGDPMGYGWHWNYTGDTATIVLAYESGRPTTGAQYAGPIMISSQYSLHVTKSPRDPTAENPLAQTWTAVSNMVVAPQMWGIDRGLTCIVGPVGNTMMQKKTPGRSSPVGDMQFAGSGPFYSYYDGDNLMVWTVTVSYSGPKGATISTSPYVADGAINMPGLNASGFYEQTASTSAHWNTTFSCGLLTTGALSSGSAESGGYSVTAGAASLVGPYGGSFFTTPATAGYAIVSYGAPQVDNADGSKSHYLQQRVACDFLIYAIGRDCNYPIDRQIFTRYSYGTGVAVIPTGDAEALFLWNSTVTAKAVTATDHSTGAGLGAGFERAGHLPAGNYEEFMSEAWRSCSIGAPSTVTGPGEPDNTPTYTYNNKLNTHAGSVTCDANTCRFWVDLVLQVATDDLVTTPITVLSGTPDSNGICPVITVLDKNMQNMPDNTIKIPYPALIGWV